MPPPIRPKKPKSNNVIPKPDAFAGATNMFTPESSRDPVARLADILTMPGLSAVEKQFLIHAHQTRFKNRRTMAYISLGALIILFLTTIIGIWSDGFYVCPDDELCRQGILKIMNDNDSVVVWISGFFTSIVAAYYGSTILRPSS